ncbi:hypothetical protein H5410_023382 [Solanum commersonii]|uniref:Uncharacterized protein n=1 Tax=Solanum commersonii TaxID=4109 RepID=A0A9J5ZI35_SOLCO|nr:hypothetical protein H5410_023382 [Solanum commersonii]
MAGSDWKRPREYFAGSSSEADLNSRQEECLVTVLKRFAGSYRGLCKILSGFPGIRLIKSNSCSISPRLKAPKKIKSTYARGS